jgi:hypothetical protein
MPERHTPLPGERAAVTGEPMTELDLVRLERSGIDGLMDVDQGHLCLPGFLFHGLAHITI